MAVVLVGAAVVLLLSAAKEWSQASGVAAAVMVVALGAPALLTLWVLAATTYTVGRSTLRIRSGPFTWRIAISSITGITPTRSILSGPALSLRRLRVEYGPRRSVLISPADQQGFLRAIGSSKRTV